MEKNKMAVTIEVDCPAENCKFRESCTLRCKGQEGIEYTPTLKIRMVRLKLEVKCFSFKRREDED